MPSERPTKRSRVSRACDQCRTAREKCDGTQPACLTCLACKRPCTYTAAPKKRGIQPGKQTLHCKIKIIVVLIQTGYIRTLELALTWLFQQNPESEATLNRKLVKEGNSSILLSRDSRESNKLHKSWRRSRFCKDVDKLLSGEQLQPADETSPTSDDEESDLEVEAASQTPQVPTLPSPGPAPSSTLSTAPKSTQFGRPPSSTCQRIDIGSPHVTLSSEVTRLPADSWRLLDIYFAYTQSWLPICEKHELLRVSYSYPEGGRTLTSALPDSGDHAELWSVLVVGAHQSRMDRTRTEVLPDIDWMYGTARSLVPTELGSFDLGHIKALLNLAVVNIGRGKNQVAWLLVGSASRLITLLERGQQASNPRWKHVIAGCFLLDNLLSLHLHRRPYLGRSDVGTLQEDGLEEWQPWTGPLIPSSAPPSRTPVLGLSSFNKLLDIADLLASSTPNQEQSTRQLRQQLDLWKGSLPAKFEYITDKRKATPPNPPALLLQLTYISSLFALNQSTAQITSAVDLLERFRGQLGVPALPPIILCLLERMQLNTGYVSVEQQRKVRLQEIITDVKSAWAGTACEDPITAPIFSQMQPRTSIGAYQVPTPESIQAPYPACTQPTNRPASSQHRATASLLEDLLPDMNPAASTIQLPETVPNFGLSPSNNTFQRPLLHHTNFTASHDLEMFFDELASLDGTEKVDNQPQFMQNLGFASDASMADFLAAEFSIPSNFPPQYNDDPSQLNSDFFNPT